MDRLGQRLPACSSPTFRVASGSSSLAPRVLQHRKEGIYPTGPVMGPPADGCPARVVVSIGYVRQAMVFLTLSVRRSRKGPMADIDHESDQVP